MKTYYQVLLSAHSDKNAHEILNTLVEKKFISGGRVTVAPSTYWWKGKIVEKDPYWNISCFTEERHIKEIKKEVKGISDEIAPIIAFFKIEHPNEEFVSWIEENIK